MSDIIKYNNIISNFHILINNDKYKHKMIYNNILQNKINLNNIIKKHKEEFLCIFQQPKYNFINFYTLEDLK